MLAVLLCAGFATRMWPLTKNFPKPLLKVGGKPVIDYFMDQLSCLPEIRDIHIVTNSIFREHFKVWQKNWIDTHEDKKSNLQIHDDGTTANEKRLGAVGDLQFVFKKIGAPTKTIVSAGDNIYRFQIEPVWRHFLEGGHHYVVSLPENNRSNLQRTGVLLLGQNGQVLKVYEKPQEPPSTWFCPPLYFLQASAWLRLDEYIKKANNFDELGNFIDFLCQKEKVLAFKTNKSRLDIGNLDSYREADEILRMECVFL